MVMIYKLFSYRSTGNSLRNKRPICVWLNRTGISMMEMSSEQYDFVIIENDLTKFLWKILGTEYKNLTINVPDYKFLVIIFIMLCLVFFCSLIQDYFIILVRKIIICRKIELTLRVCKIGNSRTQTILSPNSSNTVGWPEKEAWLIF